MSDETRQTDAEEQQVKEAKLRAFSMGIGRFCKEAGIDYDSLAVHSGVKPDDLAPALANLLEDAAEQWQ